jgi:hypothetical protein
MAILGLQTVLDNLENVSVNSDGGYRSDCPLCGRPTLSVKQGSSDLSLVVRCFGPCSILPVRAIFAAIEGRSKGFDTRPAQHVSKNGGQ